jgi:acetyl-CoA C-acetyltransferase
MTSESVANNLEIPKNNWVYLMGCADLNNIHEITQRPSLHTSPASREGSKLALKQAGLELNNIDAFDLYSCFPSIVEIMMKEIGIPEYNSRNLTLTGGLPYFGGPWSNYSLHAIASAFEEVNDNPQSNIMVVANGGYNSKQSFGIYGKQPPEIPFGELNSEKIQKQILDDALEPPVKKANGTLTIEGYTIIYNREQEPKEGIVIGKLDSKRRTLAFIKESPKILRGISKQELVGKRVGINYDEELNGNIINFR